MGKITVLLRKAVAGDRAAASELCPLVYRALHERADQYMGRERPGHTLQPTVLVHDAYLRLLGGERLSFQNRGHFYALAAREMRRILREHARRLRPPKIAIVDLPGRSALAPVDALALADALERLESINERAATVVQLRVLAGLRFNEISRHLDVSVKTVHNDWKAATAVLRGILSEDE